MQHNGHLLGCSKSSLQISGEYRNNLVGFFRAVTLFVASAPSLFPQQCGVADAKKASRDLLLQQVAPEEAEAVPLMYL